MGANSPPSVEENRAQAHDKNCALIREQVLNALGTPRDLLLVQVRELWAGRFRVNIIVGESANAARVAESYYVSADRECKVTSTVPNLVRRY